MSGKHRCWGLFLVLLAGLLVTAPAAQAGPFLGYFGWCWNPGPDCPPPLYCPWHYWNPVHYRIRGWVHPSYLDQYPPGPQPAPPNPIQIDPSRCRSNLPFANTPYRDATTYFGRSIKSTSTFDLSIPP
jgi:hypothetical protein